MKKSDVSDPSAYSNLRKATSQQLALLQKSPIGGLLPYTFADTGFVVGSLGCKCGSCDSEIPLDEVRGIISDLVPSVLDIDVLGKCRHCGIYTPYRIRIRSNRIYEWQEQDGNWCQSKIYESNFKGVKAALSDMFLSIAERIRQKIAF